MHVVGTTSNYLKNSEIHVLEKSSNYRLTLQIIKQQESLILECISPTFWEDASEEKL